MLPPERRPWKPNWWTICPMLASLALWAGILYAGAWTASTLGDNAEPAAYAAISDDAEAFSDDAEAFFR